MALKDYGFRDQITRSGLSIPSNIAEGMARGFPKEKCRYLDIALGSSAELRTQIFIGMEIGYVARQRGKAWVQETGEISAMLVGLRATITDN
jgi:four helix bundle protein